MSGPQGGTENKESVTESIAECRDDCPAKQLQEQLALKEKEYQDKLHKLETGHQQKMEEWNTREQSRYQEKLQELETSHQQKVVQLNTKVKSLQDEISTRKRDQGQLEGAKQNLTKEVKSLKEEATKKGSELGQIKAKLQKRERELEETKARLKTDKEKAVSKLEKEVAKTNNLRRDFNDLHKKAKEDAVQMKNLNEFYLDNLKAKNDQIAENEKLCQEIKMKENNLALAQFEVRRMQQENTKLNEQLSKEWSTKVSASDSDLENISIKSRPMNIKGAYEELASQEWLEAKSELDAVKDVEERERIQLLCLVLELAEKIACETHDNVMANMAHYLQQPLCYIITAIPQDTGHQEPSTSDADSSGVPTKDTTRKPMSTSEDSANILVKELPPQLNNMIRDYVRNKADEVDVRILEMEINRQLKIQDKTSWLKDFQQNPQFQSYIKACSLLAWKMMLQKPQMKFSTKGIVEPLDEKTQDPYYGSDNPKHPKSVVMYYVTPTLYHAEHMMVKGRVCTKIVV